MIYKNNTKTITALTGMDKLSEPRQPISSADAVTIAIEPANKKVLRSNTSL